MRARRSRDTGKGVKYRRDRRARKGMRARRSRNAGKGMKARKGMKYVNTTSLGMRSDEQGLQHAERKAVA